MHCTSVTSFMVELLLHIIHGGILIEISVPKRELMFRLKREARCGIFKTKLKKTNSICINPLIFVSVEGFKVLFISAGALNNFVFY